MISSTDISLNSILSSGYGGYNNYYSPYSNICANTHNVRSNNFTAINSTIEIDRLEKLEEIKKIINIQTLKCKNINDIKSLDKKEFDKSIKKSEIIEKTDKPFNYEKYISNKEDKHYKTLGINNNSSTEEICNKFNYLMKEIKVENEKNAYNIKIDEKIFKILDAYLYLTKEKKFWIK